MLQLMYAREIFQFRVEGSFSNARAMAQLRQFYMRMLDTQFDSKLCISHWESQRHRYHVEVTTMA